MMVMMMVKMMKQDEEEVGGGGMFVTFSPNSDALWGSYQPKLVGMHSDM